MLTLARALIDYDMHLLQVIASHWDVDLLSGDRASAAEELAATVIRPDVVKATWERLGEEEKHALYDLISNEGQLSFSYFVRRYGELRPMGPARRERERPWLDPVSTTERLYYRGLVTRVFEQAPVGAQEYIVIPSDLLALLPQPEPGTLAQPPGYPVAPPRKLKGGQYIAPDDMATLLAYLRLRDEQATKWLSPEPIDNIDRHLRLPHEPTYRAMLTQLAYDLELAADEEVLTQVVTRVNRESTRPWLEAPRLHQLRSLAEAWLQSQTWNELAYTPGLEADEWPNDPRLARQAILAALQDLPAEIWWSLDGFVEYIKNTNPDFQRPGGDYAAWYLRDAYTDEILHGFRYWEHIEGTLIRFVIEGPMRWLGLMRAARGAFLLTPLGLALLGREAWPSMADPEARIQLDEQGILSVPVHLSRYDRFQIARFATWLSTPQPIVDISVDGSGDDGAYLYRLTPQSIIRVVDEGVTLQNHIIPFLQRLSSHEVPANVLKMLQAWHDRPGEVVVQDVAIVTAKDLGVYERLRRNDQVTRWLGQQVGPHAHAVRRKDLPALLNALREMGILPLFEGHEKDDWP